MKVAIAWMIPIILHFRKSGFCTHFCYYVIAIWKGIRIILDSPLNTRSRNVTETIMHCYLEVGTLFLRPKIYYISITKFTRMYSSRMPTVRSSSSLLGGGEGVCPGGCLPGGCLPRGVCIPACSEADTPCGQNS